MAEKHKSKYKAPKDLEKSQKPKARKDLKDYTYDDKDGKLNPRTTGDKQLNVLRKTDKEMVDDGKYDVKYNADVKSIKGTGPAIEGSIQKIVSRARDGSTTTTEVQRFAPPYAIELTNGETVMAETVVLELSSFVMHMELRALQRLRQSQDLPTN